MNYEPRELNSTTNEPPHLLFPSKGINYLGNQLVTDATASEYGISLATVLPNLTDKKQQS